MTYLEFFLLFLVFATIVIIAIIRYKKRETASQKYVLTFTQTGYSCEQIQDGTFATLLQCTTAGNGAYCLSTSERQCNSIQGNTCQAGEIIYANEQLCNESFLPYALTLTTTGAGYECATSESGTYLTLNECIVDGDTKLANAYCFLNKTNVCTAIKGWPGAVCPEDQIVAINQTACNSLLNYEIVYETTGSSYSCEQTSTGPYGTYYTTPCACFDAGQESRCYSETNNECVQIPPGTYTCQNKEQIYSNMTTCNAALNYGLIYGSSSYECTQLAGQDGKFATQQACVDVGEESYCYSGANNDCTLITGQACPVNDPIFQTELGCNGMLKYELSFEGSEYACTQVSGSAGTFITEEACNAAGQQSYCFSNAVNECVPIGTAASCPGNELAYATKQACTAKLWYNLSFPEPGKYMCTQTSQGQGTYYPTLDACNGVGNQLIMSEYCFLSSSNVCVPDVGSACCGQQIYGNADSCVKSECVTTGVACIGNDLTYTCLPSLCYGCVDGLPTQQCNAPANAYPTEASICTDAGCVCRTLQTEPATEAYWTTYSANGGPCDDPTCVSCVTSPTGIIGGTCPFVPEYFTSDQGITQYDCTVALNDGTTDIMVCPDGTPCTTGLPISADPGNNINFEGMYVCSIDEFSNPNNPPTYGALRTCVNSNTLTVPIKNQLYNDASKMSDICSLNNDPEAKCSVAMLNPYFTPPPPPYTPPPS
jgi:hypothetical protein